MYFHTKRMCTWATPGARSGRAQVMEEVGARPYVVVLFNADADLPAVPDATFMQELHTALDPAHRSRLKARRQRSWLRSQAQGSGCRASL